MRQHTLYVQVRCKQQSVRAVSGVATSHGGVGGDSMRHFNGPENYVHTFAM